MPILIFSISQECVTSSGQQFFYVQKAWELWLKIILLCFNCFLLHLNYASKINDIIEALWNLISTGLRYLNHDINCIVRWMKRYPVPFSLPNLLDSHLAFLLAYFAVLACQLTGWCFLIDPAPVLIDVWVCKHYPQLGARWLTYQM